MVSFWWASVAKATTVALLRVLVLSWFVGVVSRRRKLDNEMLGGSVLFSCVSVRIVARDMEVSR